MSLFLESITPGEVHSYRRANEIHLINTPIPEARVFSVERTTYPTGETVDRNLVQLDYRLTDPTIQIPIIDPDTYEPTEVTFSAGQFALMAASVALWLMRGGKPQEPQELAE